MEKKAICYENTTCFSTLSIIQFIKAIKIHQLILSATLQQNYDSELTNMTHLASETTITSKFSSPAHKGKKMIKTGSSKFANSASSLHNQQQFFRKTPITADNPELIRNRTTCHQVYEGR